MLKISYSKQFKKDFHKKLRAGKDKNKLLDLAKKMVSQEPLDASYRDHKLIGSYKNHRECHIEPDWLLIYKIEGEEIIFERTGSHSELFR